MRRGLPLLAALLLLPACYSLTLRHGKRMPEAGTPREQWAHTFFGGLWQPSGPIRVDDLCPMGIASVEQEISFPNWAVTQLSSVPLSTTGLAVHPAAVAVAYAGVTRHLEVWTPWTLRVVCARGALKTLSIAVVRLTPRGGISEEMASLLTEALVAELRRQPGTTVMSDSDMAAALGLERQKQLLGCTDDSSCLTEIGGALGVDRLVHGSIGRVGESLVVNLTSIDPARSRAMASVSERLKGASDEIFLDALPGIAHQLIVEALVPQEAPKVEPAPEPKPPSDGGVPVPAQGPPAP